MNRPRRRRIENQYISQNRVARQKQIILEHLKVGPVTTLQMIELGILGAAARISELKEEGHNIKTTKIKINPEPGSSYIARYELTDVELS